MLKFQICFEVLDNENIIHPNPNMLQLCDVDYL